VTSLLHSPLHPYNKEKEKSHTNKEKKDNIFKVGKIFQEEGKITSSHEIKLNQEGPQEFAIKFSPKR